MLWRYVKYNATCEALCHKKCTRSKSRCILLLIFSAILQCCDQSQNCGKTSLFLLKIQRCATPRSGCHYIIPSSTAIQCPASRIMQKSDTIKTAAQMSYILLCSSTPNAITTANAMTQNKTPVNIFMFLSSVHHSCKNHYPQQQTSRSTRIYYIQ